MPRFVTQPAPVDAHRFDGVDTPSFAAIQAWCGRRFEGDTEYEHAFDRAESIWTEPYEVQALLWGAGRSAWQPLVAGDWVVRDPAGVFRAVSAASFQVEYLQA